MPAKTIPSLLAALAALVVGFVDVAHGKERRRGDTLESLAGTYRNVSGDGGRSQIESRVNAVVQDMGPLRETMARDELLASNPPIFELEIRVDGNHVSVRHDDHRTYEGTVGGSATPNEASGGTDLGVRYELREGTLVEHARADRGQASHVYRLRDGELVLSTTIRAGPLPRPIRYELRFRPVGGRSRISH